MDAINQDVLKQLQEYAALYFTAIVEANSTDGECNLKPGKYSAKEMQDSSRAACGEYVLPCDEIFDEQITIESGAFRCSFPYRRIFTILAEWEAMSKAGKLKAVFEIGEVEEKSAKVLLNEISESGTFKEKRVKLQRITGNWWIPRKVKKNQPIELYYEINGVMFAPGRQVWSDNPTNPDTVKWCERYNDDEISKLLLSFLNNDRAGKQQNTPYYAEIANRANIASQATETPEIPQETAEPANVSAEEGNEAIKHTIKPQENRVQAARKEPKRTIQISLIVQRPQSVVRNLRTSPSYHFADVRKMVVPRLVRNVPRGCFTAVMPHGSPPIRGDCAIINFLTKQSTRYG